MNTALIASAPVAPPSPSLSSPIARAVDAALRLPDASLVIYRARTLVEFKTELLNERLSLWTEDGTTSWQIGPFDGHHCHLDLDAVERVVFSAEPVSCQRGRLNYTVWFETREPSGNPYRPNGYFSVTLNRPYHADGSPREDILAAMFGLYRELRGLGLVSADDMFATQARAHEDARAASQEPLNAAEPRR